MKEKQPELVRAPKPKFASETVEKHELESQHSITLQQQMAYQQLMTNWKLRQRQSLSKNDLKKLTTYTYDPNNPDFSVYQKPVSEQREDIFGKYTNQISKYLKAKYIVEQIIEPIRDDKILDQEIIWNIQFLYLLSFRAWCEINAVLKSFNEKKINVDTKLRSTGVRRDKALQKIEFVFNPSDVNLKYLVDPMIKLATRIDVIFEFYHRTLTLRQHYFKNKIKAFFDFIFNNQQKKKHDKYLCGFENLDFTREQQIEYVYSKYIQTVIKQIKVLKGIKYEHLIQRMSIFKKVLGHKFVKIQGYDDFEILKKSLIHQYRQEQKERNTVTPTPKIK